MKKNILKILVVMSILIVIISIAIESNALTVEDTRYKTQQTILSFIDNLKTGNPEALKYIDVNNKKLYNTANEKINFYKSIDCEIINVIPKDGYTKVIVNVSAKGEDWKVDNFVLHFDVKKIDGQYKIIETDFFEVVSPEFTVKIIIVIIGVTFLAILAIVYITTTIIVVVITIKKYKKNRKK